jgi:hypothetical protein
LHPPTRLPTTPTQDIKYLPAGTTLDFNTLLPANRSYVTYAGSLTTPPCTEGGPLGTRPLRPQQRLGQQHQWGRLPATMVQALAPGHWLSAARHQSAAHQC